MKNKRVGTLLAGQDLYNKLTDLVTNSNMPYRNMTFKEYNNKLKNGEA